MHAFPFALSWPLWSEMAFFLLAVLGGLAFFLMRRGSPLLGTTLGLLGLALAVSGAGGILVPSSWGRWLIFGSAGTLVALLTVLVLTSAWSRWLAAGVAAVGFLGLGAIGSSPLNDWLIDAGYAVVSLRFKWYVLLLLPIVLIPVLFLLGLRSLLRGELRPWIAFGLRSLLVLGVGVALAEPYLAQPDRHLTVLFVLDRSLSIPEEMGDDPAQPGSRTDLRWARVRKFINEAVEKRGVAHKRDKVGLVVFGKRPRLELPPSDAPRFNLVELPPMEDGTYTDIGAALKLALASFPEGSARRIVLLTDGNENLGNAEEQARLAKTLGVQIDVVPLAAGQRNEDEIMVERVDAPPVIETGAVVPVRVSIRSHNPNIVVGRLTVRQITDKEGRVSIPVGAGGDVGIEFGAARGKLVPVTSVKAGSPAARAGIEEGDQVIQLDGANVSGTEQLRKEIATRKPGTLITLTLQRDPVKVVAVRDNVRLRFGLNTGDAVTGKPFSFDRPQTEDQRSYSYEAVFEPVRVEDEKGALIQNKLPGDRIQNNRASAHVVARGQGRVLLLENEAGAHKELVRRLEKQGKGRFQVVAEPVDVLDNFKDKDKLAVFLSNFDCVIIANVPRERISDEQQEVIRANTEDQGAGLVMIGGPDGFGAGGWQNTPIEKALPVDCDIKSLKMSGKGGLVLIMHASEMADGNRWQKKIAKLAIEKLGPADKVGVVDFDGQCKWHIDFQEVGENKARLLQKVDTLVPGDMPDFDPALQLAHDALNDKELSTRHIIIISDGDPAQQNAGLLKAIRDKKMTITTVGVATHGAPQDQALAAIASPKTAADMARGLIKGEDPKRKYYKVDDPKTLPAIYTREARLVSQSFIHKVRFTPEMVRTGPLSGMKKVLPLRAYVRTTPKPHPLVEVPIVTPKFADQEFPILAYWHYGLGKAVAFTSDAGQPEFWARDWAEGEGDALGIFAGFWESVIAWSLRPVESGRLQMLTEYRDGKIKVTVDARTKDGKPDTNLKLRAAITLPGKGGKQQALRFTQKNAGSYEAEIKAEEAGSYFVTAQATTSRKVKGKDGKEHIEEEGVDSVRAGVTLPYSPEFSDMETNTPLLERIRDITGGQMYEDDAIALADAVKSGQVFRAVPERTRSSLPFFHWLLFLAAGLLLCDVAVRRLAVNMDEVSDFCARVWARLRGMPLPPVLQSNVPARLGVRPVSAGLARPERAGRRFESEGIAPAPGVVDASAPGLPKPTKPGPAGKPGVPPPVQPEAQTGDAMDRLMKAKKRALQDRNKEDDKKE